MSNNPSIKQSFRLLLFIESFIFPMLFLYYAIMSALKAIEAYFSVRHILFKVFTVAVNVEELSMFCLFLIYSLLILFNLLVAWSLLIRRKLAQSPQGVMEVIVPLVAMFFYLSYNLVEYFPKTVDFFLIPDILVPYAAFVGCFLVLLGALMSVVGTFQLRHSFAIFVEVRGLVFRGLYRYVRHPLYCAYIINSFGFYLIYPHLYYFLLAILMTALLSWRAMLEEKKLSAYSPEYKTYMQKVPFLLPFPLRK